ncbi:hypothetical protein [Pseudonocardia phyllosphaerae]|uniref:hypothetical protein n=1 Tax=Pseudonocardia phyllosphaerae TaxID=3390502 RepID=UPI00397D0CED
MPEDTDSALIFGDRGGLVRADQGPPDPAQQKRVVTLLRVLGWWRYFGLAPIILIAAGAIFGATVLLVGVLLLFASLFAAGLVSIQVQRTRATAGLPVPIERTKDIASALRAVGKVGRFIRKQKWRRRNDAYRQGLHLTVRCEQAVERTRAAWVRGDIVGWHEAAQEIADAGPRANRLLRELEPPTPEPDLEPGDPRLDDPHS